MRTKKIPKNR